MTENSKTKVDDLKKVLAGKKKGGGTPPELQALQEKLLSAEEGAKKNEEEALRQAQDTAKQNYDRLLRVMAEFDNYKKRIVKDQEDRVQYHLTNLVKELLPVLDDFDRVLHHLPQANSEEIKGIMEGVELTHRHFTTALQKLGLHEVETSGQKFDPHFHEALGAEENDTAQPGSIVTCHRKGYLLKERLIRPALVTVAKVKDTSNNENPQKS